MSLQTALSSFLAIAIGVLSSLRILDNLSQPLAESSRLLSIASH